MMAIADLGMLQSTVDWLKEFLRERHDLAFTHVVHRPPFWVFYDAEGDFVVKLEEEWMDRLHLALNRDVYTLGVPERIDELMQEDELFAWEGPDDDDDIEWEKA